MVVRFQRGGWKRIHLDTLPPSQLVDQSAKFATVE
jgi:hypothetical protein